MPRAVLIGPPGAGKSSVGRALAKLLQCEILDTDNEIESITQKKIYITNEDNIVTRKQLLEVIKKN